MGKIKMKNKPNISALGWEAIAVGKAWIQHAVVGVPLRVGGALMASSPFTRVVSLENLGPACGASVLALLDELGPVYGKACQIGLSRMPSYLAELIDALRLDRLYGKWPEIPVDEIEAILDEQLPVWRKRFKIDPLPLGVASIAQVHLARGFQGEDWVVKVVKPHAERRLRATIEALEIVLALAQPVAVTLAARRLIRELDDLCQGFKKEVDLRQEAATISKVRERLVKRHQVLKVPAVCEDLVSPSVLVMQHFKGVPLSDVVSHKHQLSTTMRRKLARRVLHELLVQVFEVGLFHADPHAGNLILLEDGSVGLFDWGLSGELVESDRRHIAAILRAVLALDIERLTDALQQMAIDAGKDIKREKIRNELDKLAKLVTRVQSSKASQQAEKSATKPPNINLQQFIEASLQSAERLEIPVPNGLLLMAKSLMTIEALAKGIDPDVGLGRVATPFILRAAKPGFRDLVALGMRMPKLARRYFSR